jgi:hypothetical protein
MSNVGRDMSDLEKILVTSMLTVLGGVVVFAVGQLLSKFVIEPVNELRKAIGEVRYNLLFFAPDILTPIGRTRESCDKVRDALRKNSSDLYIRSEAIPFYPLTSRVFRGSVPPRDKVADVGRVADCRKRRNWWRDSRDVPFHDVALRNYGG